MTGRAKSKSKIIAVSVDNTTLDLEGNDATATEAQEMDKVVDEIKAEPQFNEVEILSNDPNLLQPIEEEVAKPKARAKPKPKVAKLVEQPVVAEEVKPVEQPVAEKKRAELIECPDCKKKLTAKTLKYNHVHNCPANKFKEPEKPETKEEYNQPDILPPSEPAVMKPPTAREMRAMKREKLISSLITQAF